MDTTKQHSTQKLILIPFFSPVLHILEICFTSAPFHASFAPLLVGYFSLFYPFFPRLNHQVARCGSGTPAAEETDERFPCRPLLRGPSIQTEGSGSQRPRADLHGRSGPWRGQPGKLWHLVPLQHQVCASQSTVLGICIHVFIFLFSAKIVENEGRSDPPDESPLLLSTAARVSQHYVYPVGAMS